MATTTALPTTHEATKNRDGTWNVLNVPIFAEIPAKTPGATPLVSREWIEAAVEKDKKRYASGFASPLHIHHHEHHSPGAPKPKRAGQIRLREVRQASYDGAEIGVLFADLEKVPAAVYDRIKKGTLPYRSVEILDPRENEISSCALLDSEVPFFRFPNLAVSLERPNLRFSAPRRLVNSPVTACVKSGRTRGFLFHAQGVTQMIENDDGSEITDAIEVEPIVAPETEAPNDEAIESAAERMFSLFDALSTKVEGLSEKLDELSQQDTPDITPDSPVTGEEINETPAVDPETFSASEAKLHGRLMALEQRLADEDKEKTTTSLYSAALKTLEEYNLTDEIKARLQTFAAQGEENLGVIVQTFQETLTKFPAPTVEDATDASGTPDSDAVAAYSADTKKHARARALEGQYNELKSNGLKCSLPEFIESNMNRAAPAAPAKE